MKAFEYIEKGWCQLSYALNISGESISPISLGAEAWCLTGALHAASPSNGGNYYNNHADRIRIAAGIVSLVGWNDAPERTQSDVYELLKGMNI